MILARNTFQIQPGQMRHAIESMKKGREIGVTLGLRPPRIMCDITGHFWTLIFETEFTNLAEFETQMPKLFANDEWHAWYQGFTKLVQEGHRELFQIVD
jgi:hypothetical protein